MASTKPIPVRLSDDVIKRLDSCAQKIGNNRAALIKHCLSAFLDSYEKNGSVILPLNWEEIVENQDGRTKGGRNPAHIGTQEAKLVGVIHSGQMAASAGMETTDGYELNDKPAPKPTNKKTKG